MGRERRKMRSEGRKRMRRGKQMGTAVSLSPARCPVGRGKWEDREEERLHHRLPDSISTAS